MKSSTGHPRIAGTALILLLALTGTALAQSPEKLDKRLTLVERKLDSAALGEMSNDIEALRQRIQHLHGEIEQMQRQLQEINERQRNIYSDVDSRLRELEQGGAGASSSGKRPTASTSDSQSMKAQNQSPAAGHDPRGDADRHGTAAGDAGKEEKKQANDSQQTTDQRRNGNDLNEEHAAYEHAFNTLRDGRYADAQRQFQEFLRRYPNGQYADNARYWLGESYYVGRHFEQAMEEFQKLLDEFPDSTKRAGARLKIGFIQYEQGEIKKARKTLDTVLQRYPNSTAANLAQQRLTLINNEQR